MSVLNRRGQREKERWIENDESDESDVERRDSGNGERQRLRRTE